MASIKISGLTEQTTASDTDLLPVASSAGMAKRMTLANFVTWLTSKLNSKFAPAGFGLGESGGRYCDNPDLVTTPGFYSMGGENVVNSALVGTTFSIFKYGTLLVENRYGFIWQTFKYNGYVACRFSTNEGTSWSELEWVNPPMELGIEYRTTERYLGKPVYVRAVDFGPMPNNDTRYFNHGIANIAHAISAYGSIADGWSAFPAIGIDSQAGVLATCSFTTTQIRVWCSADWTDSTCVVVLKYTKTTD